MITLTRFGIREWGAALIAAVVLWLGAGLLCRAGYCGWATALAIFALVFFCAVAAFFRNPHRVLAAAADELVSPADGVVRDIEEVEFDQAPFDGKALRIGIFLSVLNVHVNRAPAKMKVVSVHYREGRYLDARAPECVKENEAMTIAGEAVAGEGDSVEFPLAVRQISGAIARRIVCPVQPGRTLAKSEVYGMIKFGSRTEIYLPLDRFNVKVKVGDKVYGGATVVAALKAE